MKTTLLTTLKPLSVLLFFVFFGALNASAQSTDLPVLKTYRFSVDGIATPEQAETVQAIFEQQIYTAGIRFIDECDCFKIDINQEITYADLKAPMTENNLLLSPTADGSDGSVLKESMNNLIKE